MCYGCWEEAGKPTIDTPAVRAAAAAIAEVYEHSCVGGNLHVVLDDWNLEDGNLEFCDGCIQGAGQMPLEPDAHEMHHQYNERKAADPDPPDQLAAERRCHDLLKPLTEDERASALALHEGFWKVEEAPSTDAVRRRGEQGN